MDSVIAEEGVEQPPPFIPSISTFSYKQSPPSQVAFSRQPTNDVGGPITEEGPPPSQADFSQKPTNDVYPPNAEEGLEQPGEEGIEKLHPCNASVIPRQRIKGNIRAPPMSTQASNICVLIVT